MEANEWWRRKQEEIDRADPSEQARADLKAIKDQIDDDIYELLLGDRPARVPTACGGEDRVPGGFSPDDVGAG
jgi:hypothetical protein